MNHECILRLLQEPFPIDKTSLKRLKYLKFLIKEPQDAIYFIQNKGLEKLEKFLEVDECKGIALSLLANCCVDVKASSFIVQKGLLYQIMQIMEAETDAYTLKSCNRILYILCKQKCEIVTNSNDVKRSLLVCLEKPEIESVFLHTLLETIKKFSAANTDQSFLKLGLTCKLSKLLRTVPSDLIHSVLKLIETTLKKGCHKDMDVQNNIKLTLQNFASIMSEQGERSQIISTTFISNILLLNNVVPFVGPSGILVYLVDTLKNASTRYKYYLLSKIYQVLLVATNRYHFLHETNGLSQLLEYLKDPSMKDAVFDILRTICLLKSSDKVKKVVPKVVLPFCVDLLVEYTDEKLSELNERLLNKEPTKVVSRLFDINTFHSEAISNVKETSSNCGQLPRRSTFDSKMVLSIIDNLISSIDFQPSSKFVRALIYHYVIENAPEANILIKKMLCEYWGSSHTVRKRRLFATTQMPLFGDSTFEPTSRSIQNHVFLETKIFKSYIFEEFIKEMYLPLFGLFRRNIKFEISNQNDPTGMIQCIYNYTSTQKGETHLKELLKHENIRLPCSLSLCYLQKLDSMKALLSDELLEELVGIMYNHDHPLRILSISSVSFLVSSVPSNIIQNIEQKTKEKKKIERKYDNEYDVVFEVEGERVNSVKAVLMKESDVFEAMFSGSFIESSSKEITICDSTPEAFRVFNEVLLYSDFSLVSKIENADLLMEVLKLSNRYVVTWLEECIAIHISYNIPTYFESLFHNSAHLFSRSLLTCCIIHACEQISQLKSYEPFLYLLNNIEQMTLAKLIINSRKLSR